MISSVVMHAFTEEITKLASERAVEDAIKVAGVAMASGLAGKVAPYALAALGGAGVYHAGKKAKRRYDIGKIIEERQARREG